MWGRGGVGGWLRGGAAENLEDSTPLPYYARVAATIGSGLVASLDTRRWGPLHDRLAWPPGGQQRSLAGLLQPVDPRSEFRNLFAGGQLCEGSRAPLPAA